MGTMGTKMKVGSAALLISLMAIDQVFAGSFIPVITPSPSPVPEIDGSSGIAAIALLASIGAIFLSRSRNN